MTYTGLSCRHKREKNKHGCSNSKDFYCSNSGKIIDPLTCNKNCSSFEPVCHRWQRGKKKDDEVIL